MHEKLCHLSNKRRAVEEALREYGASMPKQHRYYKATGLLPAIADALRRIEQGTYGICVACGMPIAGDRLEVLPEAARCVTCAEEMERGRV